MPELLTMSIAEAYALGPLAGLVGLFVILRVRLHKRGIAWPFSRDAAFVVGIVCVGSALDSPIAAHDEEFPAHAVQHLLLAMAAPLAFALAAPITLMLRAGSGSPRRLLVALLHAPLVRVLSWAPVGAALSVGGMWLLYVTPLYQLTLEHPWLHVIVHVHMLVVGSLFAFSLAGADPVALRGGRRTQVAALFVSFAGHAVLAKYLYVHGAALATADSAAQWRTGAQVLWYGGDVLELALTVAMFLRWHRADERRVGQQRRRERLAVGACIAPQRGSVAR